MGLFITRLDGHTAEIDAVAVNPGRCAGLKRRSLNPSSFRLPDSAIGELPVWPAGKRKAADNNFSF